MSWHPDLEAKAPRVGMLTKIKNPQAVMKTLHLVLFPVVISLLPISVLVWTGSAGYRDTPAQSILSGVTFLLWGSMGLPMIIRKEIPWASTAPGWVAVVQGAILILIGWGIALGFVILWLNSLL